MATVDIGPPPGDGSIERGPQAGRASQRGRGERIPMVGVGDRDERLGPLADALAEQLGDAPLGDDGPDVRAGRDDAGALLSATA